MMFAKKCPKCGGKVQTKAIKKAIGLGTVDIPVSQFCLNPSCDWYQDFAEAKKPDEIKENVLHIGLPNVNKLPEIKKPAITSTHAIALGGIIVVVLVLLIISSILQSQPGFQSPGKTPGVMQTPTPVLMNPEITSTPSATQAPDLAVLSIAEPKIYQVKIDVANGFVPKEVTINKSDIVQWNDQENQRTRIVLVSNDKLFEGKIMQDPDRFSYQFNESGNYIFVLEEYPTLKIFPNATGRVIVK